MKGFIYDCLDYYAGCLFSSGEPLKWVLISVALVLAFPLALLGFLYRVTIEKKQDVTDEITPPRPIVKRDRDERFKA